MELKQSFYFFDGKAKGLYINLAEQTIGYKGSKEGEIHLEYLQSCLLSFMLNNADKYINATDIATEPELFSINLSKYIYEIKKKCLRLLQNNIDTSDAELLFEDIIDKKTINGKRGYRLRFDYISIEDTAVGEAVLTGTDSEAVNLPPRSFRAYLRNNWLPLFIYLFLILTCILLYDFMGISSGALLSHVITAPFGIVFLALCVLSVLPIAGGLFIDVPLALKNHSLDNDDTSASTIEGKHKIAMYLHPRFDNSPEHIKFFLLANLTGAFTVAAEILYASKVSGINDFIENSSLGSSLSVILIVSCLVALSNNYSLQTKESPSRVPANYLLSRAHAFLNLIYLTLTVFTGSSLVYMMLIYRFGSSGRTIGLTPAYTIMLISACCYLWFTSDSPGALDIDSVSSNNFIAGIPLINLFSILYTISCSTLDATCVLSLACSLLFLIMWGVWLIKRQQSLHGFYTSVFSFMAVCVISLLIINVVL